MTWLVTGGAGYIGSHVVKAFTDTGTDVMVLDSLSSGHRQFVPADVAFVHANVLDRETVTRTLAEHDIAGVVHLAGFKYAGVSVQRPLHTYEQNVTGTATLLAAMQDTEVGNIVFSSSASTFGTPDVDLVTEDTPPAPESPYGETKLIGEWLLRDQARATALRHTSLRYFNVVGSGARAVRHQPAQPVPAGAGRARRGAYTADQRRRLPHAGRHLRAGLRPRQRSRRLPRRGRASTAVRCDPRPGLQPWQR